MKKEFGVDGIHQLIKEKLQLNSEELNNYIDLFNKFFPERITLEYLSHIRCALEFYGRKNTANKLFTITLKPITITPGDEISGNDCISHIVKLDLDDPASSLIIVYPCKIISDDGTIYNYEPNEIRMAIAHELAHAYFLIHHITLKKELENKGVFEEVSSLLGIIMMQDRSFFYKNTAIDFAPELTKIINDTVQLHNKKDGKFNIS